MDKTTGAVILKGTSHNGVYPIRPTVLPESPSSPVTALDAVKQSGDVWHARLGHTSSRVLGQLCSNKLISCSSKFIDDCSCCKLG